MRVQHILQDVWDDEVIPDAWKRGTIIKLPMKGNLSECCNWGGITLLSITSNVFCSIILQRITTAVDKLLRQEQAGIRNGKLCFDHIFVLCHILEQSNEWISSLYAVFMDLEKVFDSLHRPSLDDSTAPWNPTAIGEHYPGLQELLLLSHMQ